MSAPAPAGSVRAASGCRGGLSFASPPRRQRMRALYPRVDWSVGGPGTISKLAACGAIVAPLAAEHHTGDTVQLMSVTHTLHDYLHRWAANRPDAHFLIEAETGAALTYREAAAAVA